MAKLIVKDRKGELEKVAKRVIKKNKEFHILKKLNILYVWRLGDMPLYDDEGRAVAAQTKKLANRERDVYGYDVEIQVFKQSWRRRSKKGKYKLMYHELRHIEVEQDEEFKPNRDDDGRIVFKIVPHDVVITAFESEIKKFGLPGHSVPDATVVAKALKQRKKKKKE